jgi:hypothetical protein
MAPDIIADLLPLEANSQNDAANVRQLDAIEYMGQKGPSRNLQHRLWRLLGQRAKSSAQATAQHN